ncbi:MAG: YesN/AraC family two-component response regulator [Flavobacteriales bacterium]|jgi:YesN/AraC family two-component response regulator
MCVHLMVVFENATAQSPLQYLQGVRIEIAKDLLQTSNLNVSEVADKIGYPDVGYFTALFVKLLSTSPREYQTTLHTKLFKVD